MKTLILGSNGQLGRSLTSSQWDTDVEMLSLAREDLDITNFELVKSFLSENKSDVVINATAWTNVPGAESDPSGAYKLNSEAVGNLASQCRSIGALLVHVSTDYVFDGKKQAPYTESDATSPLNVYGKSKLAGEMAIQNSGIKDFYIVRTSWLYSRYGKNFVKTIANKAVNGEASSISNDQFGVPTYAGDLAKGIQSLITSKPESGVYHFSNTDKTNWFEFGSAIYELLGKDLDLVTARATERGELLRPSYSVFDLSKWERSNLSPLIDWKVRLEDELPLIVEALKSEAK